MRTLEAIRIHVQLLVEHIGHLEPHQVHDAKLAPLTSKRIADGVCAVTINRTLEVARTILHRAARSYPDETGRPWLDALPPLISMLPECPRSPYPINLRRAGSIVSPTTRASGTHGAFRRQHRAARRQPLRPQWAWEVPVSEIGRSVFARTAAVASSRSPRRLERR